MRPFPSRVLLSAIAIGAFTAGALYPKVIFFVLALGAVALLATSVLTSRWPFTRALQQFEGRPVVIHLWGALPPGLSGAPILTAVNALGAGAHAFFSAEGVASMHLKIAQPRDLSLGPGRVVIASARYVQWNGQKIPRMGGAQAVSIELIEPTTRENDQGAWPNMPLQRTGTRTRVAEYRSTASAARASR